MLGHSKIQMIYEGARSFTKKKLTLRVSSWIIIFLEWP